MDEQISAPVIRALLLTDLCDSVALVERIGDMASAELFRSHDLLVLELQQRWHGRLIDRSDGMLLVFERPLHGIGFALDYLAELEALGQARGFALKARAGLHVGEVLLWENSQEAIDIGAKPLEVEGLAKPLAARLLAMARPGQVLVSAVAEALARRASKDELGSLRDRLVWKSHGAWYLKGVPTAQEVFEVGEIGTAPLRRPLSGPKAWRALPLWRRPAALMLQAVLVIAGVAGVWYATRSEPAIAFAQRDWVVLADIRNTTDNRLLNEPLQQAIRLSLEQSRYINVLSTMSVHNSLERMRQPTDTVITNQVAAEIALRDGARAVIVPVLSEVGGRLRLSAEVVDPLTQTVVYSETVDGVGQQSLLGSVDALSARLRSRLGEAMASISQNGRPLPEVATANLDALRAYALAETAYGQGAYRNALGLYEQALELDGEFALAMLGRVRTLNTSQRQQEAAQLLDRLDALSGRMPAREAMYYRAWRVQMNQPELAFERWSQLAQLYPDFHQAFANAGYAKEAEHHYPEGLPYIRRASEARYAFAPLSQESRARMAIALGQLDEARTALDQASAYGSASTVHVWKSNLAAVTRDFEQAAFQWPGQSALHTQYFDRSSQLLDQGLWQPALAEITQLHQQAGAGSERGRQAGVQLALSLLLADQPQQALAQARRTCAEALQALAQARGMQARSELTVASYAALLAYELGDRRPLQQVLAAVPADSQVLLMEPAAGIYQLLRVRQLIDQGELDAAGQLLQTLRGKHRSMLLHDTQRLYAQARGDVQAAMQQVRWLSNQRGWAYAENGGCGWCAQGYNVYLSNRAPLDGAQLLAAAGDVAAARSELAALEQAWPAATLPAHLRRRREAVLATFN